MRVIYKSIAVISRRLLRSENHASVTTRYFTKHSKPRDNPQLDYLQSVIKNKDLDWKTIKDNILSKDGAMTCENIDAIILKNIVSKKKFDSGYSFAEYLRTSSTELNLGATNALLHLYYESSTIKKPTEDVRTFILSSYKRLYDKYKVLDYFTSERLLRALCIIDEWKLSLKILDDIHLSSIPSHSTYNILIAALFRNDEKAEALKLIQRSIHNQRPLQDCAYEEWLNYILRNHKDNVARVKFLEEICLFLAENYIKLPEKTAEKFRKTFASLDWLVDYSSIKRSSGECSCCHRRLDNIELSDEEFLQLQKNVKEKIIVGSDLFLKTSPAELDRFLKFIDRTKPYDVVLDSLNICYLIGKSNYIEKLKTLKVVVDYFYNQNKKILLLGRKHMFKWPGPILKELTNKSFSFFTEDLSQDDPYFITAAILSGPRTDIVSRDLLRGHRFLMKQKDLQLIFQRWQWSHQWMIYSRIKKPVLRTPLQFSPCAQKHESGWHLPYEKPSDSEEGSLNSGDPDCSAWLCLRKNVDSECVNKNKHSK